MGGSIGQVRGQGSTTGGVEALSVLDVWSNVLSTTDKSGTVGGNWLQLVAAAAQFVITVYRVVGQGVGE